MIEASKRFEISSALVRPEQRQAIVVVERWEWDWPIVEGVGGLVGPLAERFGGMVTFVKFATKLMAVRNRFCTSIYGLTAMRERFWVH